MGEFAAEDVGEDFSVAVRVGGEAGESGDAVFVQDAEGTERCVLGGVVLGEGECVVGVEPAVVGVAAVCAAARGDFCGGGEGGHDFFGGFGGCGCFGHVWKRRRERLVCWFGFEKGEIE